MYYGKAYANDQIRSLDEINRNKWYAGLLRGLKTPNQESRKYIISDGLQHGRLPEIEEMSTVGKLDGDAIFQGVYDVATSGRTPLLNYAESSSIVISSFKDK